MGHPVLDIGMPVWNRAQYIERSIRSILNQDFSYFRLIISDNGSTDGTSEICERLALQDRRIKYVRHKTNRGLVENFQAVIDLCEAEFFMLATSDDLWSENWVSDLLTIARNEDAAACGRTSYIDGDDQKRSGVQRRWQTSINNSLIRRAHYLWSLTPAPIFGIYRRVHIKRDWRQILGKWDGSQYRFRPAGDIYVCFYLLNYTRVELSDSCIRYSRIHDENSKDFDSDKTLNINPLSAISQSLGVLDLSMVAKMSGKFELVLFVPIYLLILGRELLLLVKKHAVKYTLKRLGISTFGG